MPKILRRSRNSANSAKRNFSVSRNQEMPCISSTNLGVAEANEACLTEDGNIFIRRAKECAFYMNKRRIEMRVSASLSAEGTPYKSVHSPSVIISQTGEHSSPLQKTCHSEGAPRRISGERSAVLWGPFPTGFSASPQPPRHFAPQNATPPRRGIGNGVPADWYKIAAEM